MSKITPILLAGGSGTRLWPLSRKSYPKQFSNLLGKETLFQQSALRFTSSELIEFEPHIILTNSDFRFIVGEQLQAVGIDPGNILIEPEAKNTAPAILAGCLHAYVNDPEAVIIAAPSDHVIPETSDFHSAIQQGLEKVQDGNIVTFGITPSRPETGYGYLEIDEKTLGTESTSKVTSFIEKPELALAEDMLKSGNFLWNAGIFLFKASDMIAAFDDLAPDILAFTKKSLETATVDFGFLRLNPEPWKNLKNISIDYAIMQKASNIFAVPYSSKWSDLGDWDAVWSELNQDSSGNVTSENAHVIDCSQSLLRSEHTEQQLVGLGLDNIIAIAMPDAVLVANKNMAQNVKLVVDDLKAKGIKQAELLPKDHRPWGWFEVLALGDKYIVKQIYIKPGAAISLQSHNHRSEHWVIIQGEAKVTIDDEVSSVFEGQSVYIPLGAIHRLENPGKSPLLLVEVQIGSYLAEDDIIRYEDIYLRK